MVDPGHGKRSRKCWITSSIHCPRTLFGCTDRISHPHLYIFTGPVLSPGTFSLKPKSLKSVKRIPVVTNKLKLKNRKEERRRTQESRKVPMGIVHYDKEIRSRSKTNCQRRNGRRTIWM